MIQNGFQEDDSDCSKKHSEIRKVALVYRVRVFQLCLLQKISVIKHCFGIVFLLSVIT